jgi:hypothetical protein
MWKCLFFMLYKCHNFCTKSLFILSGRPQLSTIRRKSKTLSYLDIVLCSMNRPQMAWIECPLCSQIKQMVLFSWLRVITFAQGNHNSATLSKQPIKTELFSPLPTYVHALLLHNYLKFTDLKCH